MEKTLKYVWLGFAISSAIAAVGFGAWHHLLTCGLCTVMYLATGDEEDKNEATKRP